MNHDQMKMLSVKSAVERTVQGYIASYSGSSDRAGFFDEVERYVASLFVSRQISNNYSVRSLQNGDLEIKFVAAGQHTALHIMLPNQLRWRADVKPSRRSFDDVQPYVAKQTAEERFQALVPQLEATVGMYLDKTNIAVTRERIKNSLYKILFKGGCVEALTFITCDETNNTLEDRKSGILTVNIQAQFDNELEPIFDVELKAQLQPVAPEVVTPPPKVLRKVEKTDKNLANAILALNSIMDHITLEDPIDVANAIASHLRIILGDAIHDYKVSCHIEKIEKGKYLNVLFSVQVYEDSEWLSYPISRRC